MNLTRRSFLVEAGVAACGAVTFPLSVASEPNASVSHRMFKVSFCNRCYWYFRFSDDKTRYWEVSHIECPSWYSISYDASNANQLNVGVQWHNGDSWHSIFHAESKERKVFSWQAKSVGYNNGIFTGRNQGISTCIDTGELGVRVVPANEVAYIYNLYIERKGKLV